MNKVILMGRLTADPEVRYASSGTEIARYSLAVDRIGKDAGTDFFRCIAFGKGAEFVEKYLAKGMKILATGRLQTGSYVGKDGRKVYTTDVIIESHEFAESKNSARIASSGPKSEAPADTDADGFMNIPDGIDEELPFN